VLGTPFYMAPEQARALKTIDHRADVWSLGVLAYRAVVGELPFEGESVADLLVKICTAPVPTPSSRVPGLPPAFDAWFLRALERDPERRYASVAELAEALAAAAGLAGNPAYVPQAPVNFNAQHAPIPTPVPSNQPGFAQNHTTPVFGASNRPALSRTEHAPALAATHSPFTSENDLPVRRMSRGAVLGIVATVAALIGASGVGVWRLSQSPPRGAATSSTSDDPAPPPDTTAHTSSEVEHHTPPLHAAETATSKALVIPPTPLPAASTAAKPATSTSAPSPATTAPTTTTTAPTPAPPVTVGPRLIPIPGNPTPKPPPTVAPKPPTKPKEVPLHDQHPY